MEQDFENEGLLSVPEEPKPLGEMIRSEIDIQISTAKRYPRSIQRFRQQAMSMATADEETAASCFYKLKRKSKDGGEKIIEGPSVRLAEIVASAWGNLRFGARIVDENNKFVVAQGVAHDLEKNVSNSIEVSRRITNKSGYRFSDDMVLVTKNAACSIALRNAIFKTIPFTYAKQIFEQAKKTAVGSAKTLKKRRSDMLAKLKELGAKESEILALLEVPSIEDIGLTEIETMIGTYNLIRDGESTVEDVFRPKSAKPTVEMPQPKNEEAQASSQPKSPTTDKSQKALYEAGKPNGWSKEDVKAFLADRYKAENARGLKQKEYEEVLEYLSITRRQDYFGA